MKKSEQDLLNHLQKDEIENSPLSNVMQGLGELKNVVGNPLFRAEISIEIRKQYYNWDGANWNPILPAAVPANLRNSIPFCILGLTDFYSGFVKFQSLIRNNLGLWEYEGTILTNSLLWAFPAVPAPRGNLGDLNFLYVDNAINFAVIINVHCASVAYGTFLNSFVSDLITVNNLRLNVNVADINQFTNPLIFGYQTLFGKLFTDSVSPRMYITNTDFQQQICDIPINFPVDKNLFIYQNMDFAVQNETITLFVQKVEALTLRKKYLKR